MRDNASNLPQIIRHVFIEELDRQYRGSKLMDKDEFRRNFVQGLHKHLTERQFELYSSAIWDVIGVIELDMLKNEHGHKLFKFINESGIPIYHNLVVRRLKDPLYVIDTINNIPEVVTSVLDYILEHAYISSDIEIIKILQKCIKRLNINILDYWASTPSEEFLVDKMSPVLSSIKEYDESKLQLKLFDSRYLDDDTLEFDLEMGINDIIETVISYYIKVIMDTNHIEESGLLIEISLAYQLEELVVSNDILNDAIGTGPKFYKILNKMVNIVEEEVMTFIIETLRQNSEHKFVKQAIAELMKYYIDSRL